MEKPLLKCAPRRSGMIEHKYKIIDEIGKDEEGESIGAFGKVYKAKKLNDNSTNLYAIKIIDLLKLEKEYGKSRDELRDRAMREYNAGLIKHDNIVRNYDYGYTDKAKHSFFYVMDYYPDGNLLDLINKKATNNQQFSLKEIEDVARQIMAGLQEFHQQGYIHRDLKPENVLRNKDRFVLADFGLCGFVSSRITRGAIGGTQFYMPLEQMEKGREQDIILPGIDIYPLGVVLYLMFALHFPFGNNEHKLKKRQKNNEWDDISKYRPDIPKHWKEVIEKCLQNDIKERFKSIDEIDQRINILPKINKPTIINEDNNSIKQGNNDVILKILNGADKPEIHNLTTILEKKNNKVITIGRNSRHSGVFNDIPINPQDLYISRKHATIEKHEDNNFYFMDGQFSQSFIKPSKNGSALNGEMVKHGQRYKLSFNDEIILGETFIRIERPKLYNNIRNNNTGITT